MTRGRTNCKKCGREIACRSSINGLCDDCFRQGLNPADVAAECSIAA